MGLIRKSMFITTGGVVSPNSKKQRVAKQTLAAHQGKSAADVRMTGGRLSWLANSGANTRAKARAKEQADIQRCVKTLLAAKDNFHDSAGNVIIPVDIDCTRLAAEGSYRCTIIFNSGLRKTYVVTETKGDDGRSVYSWAPLRG